MRILVNLLSNAAKFTPAGSEVTLEIASDGPHATALVQDQGPGIPEEFRPHLFGRFAQANSSATRQAGGTGLGLAISREITERHGGSLTLARSGPDGSVFRLELPVVQPLAKPQAADVLICEGDAEMAESMVAAVKEQGYSAAVVSDLGTLELALRGHRELLLLGLRQTDGDALSTIQRLRAQSSELPPMAIVSGEPRRSFAGMPIADWITTPLDRDRLRTAVVNVLGDLSRVRILHVEDDAEPAGVVASALEGCGTLETAHTLSEAITKVRQRRPDLVILDIGPPTALALTCCRCSTTRSRVRLLSSIRLRRSRPSWCMRCRLCSPNAA